jgi:hypothetical protein
VGKDEMDVLVVTFGQKESTAYPNGLFAEFSAQVGNPPHILVQLEVTAKLPSYEKKWEVWHSATEKLDKFREHFTEEEFSLLSDYPDDDNDDPPDAQVRGLAAVNLSYDECAALGRMLLRAARHASKTCEEAHSL